MYFTVDSNNENHQSQIDIDVERAGSEASARVTRKNNG